MCRNIGELSDRIRDMETERYLNETTYDDIEDIDDEEFEEDNEDN